MAEASNAQPVKFTITHHRKEGVTHEAFMNWISTVHLLKAIPVFKKYGVIGLPHEPLPLPKEKALYPSMLTSPQFDSPAALNDPFRTTMTVIHPTWEVADYDCVIEYTLPNIETIYAVMGDPDWAETVADQEAWVATEKALLTLGTHTKYLDGGEVVAQRQ